LNQDHTNTLNLFGHTANKNALNNGHAAYAVIAPYFFFLKQVYTSHVSLELTQTYTECKKEFYVKIWGDMSGIQIQAQVNSNPI